jgi:glycosyltransferase involved in cell wall biosynthesis
VRILFVAFPQSVHTARWISQLGEQGWDIHLFPSDQGGIHPDLKNVTTYGFGNFRPTDLDPSVRWQQLWPRRGLSRLSLMMSRFSPDQVSRSWWLAEVIRRIKPDVVHSMEFQHAGYLTLEARQHLADEKFPAWAATNWGSDIYLFGRLPEHAERIRKILSSCDYYHCECHRDVALARSFGFKGETLPVFPVTGGFDLQQMSSYRSPGKTSSRRLIALKGIQHWAGRALTGLRAIELCADLLEGYNVCVYMAHPDVRIASELVTQSTGIPIEFEPDGWQREDVLRMHGRARVSIGLSISDAISTSLLEAMAMGSFPVQSNTGCGDEWIKSGENGILVSPHSPEPVAEALRRALMDDDLVDHAADINASLTAERIDIPIVKSQAIAMYEKIAAVEDV